MSKRIYRARRVDANQQEIRLAMIVAGWRVCDTHSLGHGFPDLVASKDGVTVLVECKKHGETLTPDEKKFHMGWAGRICIVFDGQDAVDKLAELSSGLLKTRQ